MFQQQGSPTTPYAAQNSAGLGRVATASATPQPPSEVASACGELREQIEQTRNLVASLTVRLSDVLADEPPQASGVVPAAASCSALARNIRGDAEALRSGNQALLSILQRLAL